MTLEILLKVLANILEYAEIISVWENPKNGIEFNEYPKLMNFDPINLGFGFVKGRICASCIEFTFEKPNYELRVYTGWDFYNRRTYNHAILHPKFLPEHFEGRKKAINMTSVKIDNDKQFNNYFGRIAKKFPFPD